MLSFYGASSALAWRASISAGTWTAPARPGGAAQGDPDRTDPRKVLRLLPEAIGAGFAWTVAA
jgi:hypothetical protein